MAKTKTDSSAWRKAALYGIPTLALYAGLYGFEAQLIEISGKGYWNFIVPVAFAFAVSYFHGGVTSSFLGALGLKTQKKNEPQ